MWSFKPCSGCLLQAIKRALWSLHANFPSFGSLNLGGYSMKSSSCNSPFRKALFTSSRHMGHSLVIAIVRTVLIVVGFTTRLHVLAKSKPVVWWKPLCHLTSLVHLNCPIWVLFDLKNPLTYSQSHVYQVVMEPRTKSYFSLRFHQS